MMAWQQKSALSSLLATERGVITKDWGGKLPVVLAYANSYAVGMSSLAMHSLYRWFNAFPDVVCERTFAWTQRHDLKSKPLLTLESQRPVREAAVLAVSLSFELDYLNLLGLLDSANIPRRAQDRIEGMPLVLLGGPAVSANPEPLADIADAVVIGEIEPVLEPLIRTLQLALPESRAAALEALAHLAGLYVPSLYAGEPIQRLVQPTLDEYLVASSLQCPRAQFGDMHLVEISRGCVHACRFCLAGCWYLPQRERSLVQVMQQVELGHKRGQTIGLVAAAVSDYSQLNELLDGVSRVGARLAVSSLRINNLSARLLQVLSSSGDRMLTLAPEAGSERLRIVVHKGITEDDILRVAKLSAGFSFETLKLYFMYGLPTETETDISAIVTLSKKVRELSGKQVVVNVTPFVPKAHTAWQRHAMAPEQELQNRLRLLKAGLKASSITLRGESLRESIAQALLARGSRELGERLLTLQRCTSAELLAMEMKPGDERPPSLAGFPVGTTLPWHFIQRVQAHAE